MQCTAEGRCDRAAAPPLDPSQKQQSEELALGITYLCTFYYTYLYPSLIVWLGTDFMCFILCCPMNINVLECNMSIVENKLEQYLENGISFSQLYTQLITQSPIIHLVLLLIIHF